MLRKIVLVVVMVFLTTGIVFAFQNEPDGFRGLKWGDPPTEDMICIGEEEGIMIYERPTDKMGIGSAKFYSLTYRFYDQRFYNMVALFWHADNYEVLKIICEEKFGKTRKHGIEYGYYGPMWSGADTVILLKYDFGENAGRLSFHSTEIWNEKNKAEKQKELEKVEAYRQKELEKAEGDF